MISNDDIRPAERTYESFLGMVKWGGIGAACVVLLVILLIT